MEPKLNLSLPEAPRPKSPRFVPWVTLLGVLACIGLLISLRGGGGLNPSVTGSEEDAPARLKKLAEDLERRTLYDQAAQVWAEYVAISSLSPIEQGKVAYRRGKCLKEAGQHAEAARFLSEALTFKLPTAEKRNAQRLLLDSLSALGKEEVRQNVLRTFAMPGAKETGVVVAKVGGDPITREDLSELLEYQSRAILEAQGLADTPEEIQKRAKNMATEQLKDPKVAQELLQRLVTVEILYREALARGLASGQEYENAIQRMRREYLAGLVMQTQAHAAAAGITDTDLRNHYEAHLEDYVLKPAVEFSYLRYDSEEEAKADLASLAQGGDAAEAVQTRMTQGGGPAVQGEPIPGLGRSAEATAHLLALDEGKLGDRPLSVGDAWYVFRCDKKRPKRQRTFEEAAKDVQRDLARVKRAESLESLQNDLAAKFRVEIIEENLKQSSEQAPAGSPEAGTEANPSQGEAAGAAPDPTK